MIRLVLIIVHSKNSKPRASGDDPGQALMGDFKQM